MPLMAEGKILPYLDIPFQHASPRVLKSMRRPAAQAKTLERVQAWRRECPELVIRSTFIVGFPGETEAEFQELLDWLEAAGLDRVGCFRYEDVAGAAANDLAGQVPEAVKEERWHRFMACQQAISARRLERFVGQTLDVLVDQVEAGQAVGRTYADAPEIDGAVRFRAGAGLTPGQMARIRIVRSDAYDLEGKLVSSTLPEVA
jgi:ribosomal protein S12 methylthiotransferase